MHRAQLTVVSFTLLVFLFGAIFYMSCLMWDMAKGTEIDVSSCPVFASSRSSEVKKTSNYVCVRSMFSLNGTRLLLLLLLLWIGSTEGAEGELA